MTHGEMIAVIQAHRDGKTVQWRIKKNNASEHDWTNCHSEEVWNFGPAEYRIKPTPRDFWIYPVDGKSSCAIENSPCAGFVHVREVLE